MAAHSSCRGRCSWQRHAHCRPVYLHKLLQGCAGQGPSQQRATRLCNLHCHIITRLQPHQWPLALRLLLLWLRRGAARVGVGVGGRHGDVIENNPLEGVCPACESGICRQRGEPETTQDRVNVGWEHLSGGHSGQQQGRAGSRLLRAPGPAQPPAMPDFLQPLLS